jgi:hypothetical protein
MSIFGMTEDKRILTSAKGRVENDYQSQAREHFLVESCHNFSQIKHWQAVKMGRERHKIGGLGLPPMTVYGVVGSGSNE